MSYANIFTSIRNAYTLRSIRHSLQWLGLPAGRETDSSVLIGAPEFVYAAALARATIGA